MWKKMMKECDDSNFQEPLKNLIVEMPGMISLQYINMLIVTNLHELILQDIRDLFASIDHCEGKQPK